MATEHELEDLRNRFSTFEDALCGWAASRSPVPFNEWQVAFARIRGLCVWIDPEVPQTGGDYNRVVSAKTDELMEDVPGPLWKEELCRKGLRPCAKSAVFG